MTWLSIALYAISSCLIGVMFGTEHYMRPAIYDWLFAAGFSLTFLAASILQFLS